MICGQEIGYASDKEYYIRSKAHFNFTSRNCARSESELVE